MTESQTYKKRADFLSNDDYAVYVRENIQVMTSSTHPHHVLLSRFPHLAEHSYLSFLFLPIPECQQFMFVKGLHF